MLKPKKSLGQNFLKDKNVSNKIVASLGDISNKTVIEIGPGTGALTEILLAKGANVVAIELDKRAVELLSEKFADYIQQSKFRIIEADIRHIDLANILLENETDPSLVGNIPYYLTGIIFFKVFENADLLKQAVIMCQKEVAVRVVASPRSKDYSSISVGAQLAGKPKKLFDVAPGCFVPPPKIWSSVIHLSFDEFRFSKIEFLAIMKNVRIAFNQRRKKLVNPFKQAYSEIDVREYLGEFADKRAEELTPENYIELYSRFKKD